MHRIWKHCACDCGGRIGPGPRVNESWADFLPGHDQKLRAALEARMGGLKKLKALVEAHLATTQTKEVTPR